MTFLYLPPGMLAPASLERVMSCDCEFCLVLLRNPLFLLSGVVGEC